MGVLQRNLKYNTISVPRTILLSPLATVCQGSIAPKASPYWLTLQIIRRLSYLLPHSPFGAGGYWLPPVCDPFVST